MHGLTQHQQPAREERPVSVFERMSVLSDPVRCRLLLVLTADELTVSELCDILQLPQSTASRHLKTLAEAGWLRARREGTRRLYTLAEQPLDGAAAALWSIVRPEVKSSPTSAQDRRRLSGVLAARRTKSQEFFATAADAWAGMRAELFGRRFDLEGLLALVDRSAVIGDLGTGDGQLSAVLAPFVASVIAVDSSQQMLDAARSRLAEHGNVELRQGRLEALPIADGALDAAILGLVLHHMAEPERVIAEASRVLRIGGRLLILEMHPHDHQEYRQTMGHVWLGFAEQQIRDWCRTAGLAELHFHSLPPEPQAKGPTLFVASAVRQPNS